MSDTQLPLAGHCDERFASVRDAFEANFRERGEVGGAVCVTVGGETVVDLVGGWRDAARTQPWRHDTIVDAYSTGKGVLATLALQTVDAGLLDLDQAIVGVWPEFATGGKGSATIRHALSHQAGVPAIREPLTNDDLWRWDRMVAAVAATEPWFEPGSAVVYHTNTYGHLVGEIVRRATGDGPGAALRRLAEPLEADLWFGVPRSEQHRCAELLFETPAHLRATLGGDARDLDEVTRMIVLSYANPPGYGSQGVVNTEAWRSAEIPAANLHASASGLARLYRALLEPDRVISVPLRDEAARPQVSGDCPVLGDHITYGLGFVPTTKRRKLGRPGSFGHFGTGGALGFADPEAEVSFGYVLNHVIPRWQSTRNRALIDALYAAL